MSRYHLSNRLELETILCWLGQLGFYIEMPEILVRLAGRILARVAQYWACALVLGAFAASSQTYSAQDAENSSQSATASDRAP